jgi:hypothetical protein
LRQTGSQSGERDCSDDNAAKELHKNSSIDGSNSGARGWAGLTIGAPQVAIQTFLLPINVQQRVQDFYRANCLIPTQGRRSGKVVHHHFSGLEVKGTQTKRRPEAAFLLKKLED